MMAVLFAGMAGFGLLAAALSGRLPEAAAALLSGGEEALRLGLTLAGNFALWSGLMEVAGRSGLTDGLARALSPAIGVLFPEARPDPPSMAALAVSLTTGLLGLGEASVPAGLLAIAKLRAAPSLTQAEKGRACRRFVVLNCLSVQLLPTTMALLRLKAGSTAPLEVLPMVWLASAAGLLCGLGGLRLLEGKG